MFKKFSFFFFTFLVGFLLQKIGAAFPFFIAFGVTIFLYFKFLFLYSFQPLKKREWQEVTNLKVEIKKKGLYLSLDDYKGDSEKVSNKYLAKNERLSLILSLARRRVHRLFLKKVIGAYVGRPTKDVFRNEQDYLSKNMPRKNKFIFIRPEEITDEMFEFFYFRPYDLMVFIDAELFFKKFDKQLKLPIQSLKRNEIEKRKGKRYWSMIGMITFSYITFFLGVFGITEEFMRFLMQIIIKYLQNLF